MSKTTVRAALLAFIALAGNVLSASPANATLVDQTDGTVLDTTTGLFWLKDWNVNGQKAWGTQRTWAENLSFAESSEWMLPIIDEYATVMASAGNSYGGLRASFDNVVYDSYWSNTACPGAPSTVAWNFFVGGSGVAGFGSNTTPFSAVAVRATVTAPIPEPETYALMLAGLAVVDAAAKRKARRTQ